MYLYLLYRSYRDVSIVTVIKVYVVLAKAFRFFRYNFPLNHPPWAYSLAETAYFAVIFLISSMNALYHRLTHAHGLHHLFLTTLYHLLNALLSYLIFTASDNLEGLLKVSVAGLLRGPFYMCVPTLTLIAFAIEIFHYLSELQYP